MHTILKAAAAYLVALIALRVIGRRTASQSAPFDMVVLFMFGALAVNGVLGNDRSFTGAMSGLATVGLMHVVIAWLKLHSVTFERIVDGSPVVVYSKGQWNEQAMKVLRIQEADVRTSVRQGGSGDFEEVEYAIVERDGKVSIISGEKE